MNIPRIVRGKPDVIFMSVRNLHSTTLADGDVVQFLVTTDTPPTGYTIQPGIDVKQSTSAVAATTVAAGIMSVAAPTLAQGDYGLCQIYGYHGNAKCTAATPANFTVMTTDTAGALVAASVAAAANITDQRIATVIKTGVSNRAGVLIKAMGQA